MKIKQNKKRKTLTIELDEVSIERIDKELLRKFDKVTDNLRNAYLFAKIYHKKNCC